MAKERTRRIVTRLGRHGGIARGVVFAAVGVFLAIAGVKAQPSQAKGIDSRVLAQGDLTGRSSSSAHAAFFP